MNDDWLEDTTDVLHCSMPPQVRAHIEELRDENARLRAAEVPLSANVGFANVTIDGFIFGDSETETAYPTADLANSGAEPSDTVVALIPLSAWSA